jgi:hypothetical protein
MNFHIFKDKYFMIISKARIDKKIIAKIKNSNEIFLNLLLYKQYLRLIAR